MQRSGIWANTYSHVLPNMQEEVANCDRFYGQNMISARCFSVKTKKKTLATQGFLDMEHSGIEPLTSTLPA